MSRTRMVALVVPFAIAFVLLTMMLWGARSRDVERLEMQALNLEQQLAVQQGQLARAEDFVAAGPAAVSGLESVRASIPDEPALGSFITANAETAAAASVEVLSVVPEADGGENDDSALPTDVTRLGLEVNVRGADEAVVQYLEALQGLPRLTVVEDVQLTSEGLGRASAALGIAIFHR